MEKDLRSIPFSVILRKYRYPIIAVVVFLILAALSQKTLPQQQKSPSNQSTVAKPSQSYAGITTLPEPTLDNANAYPDTQGMTSQEQSYTQANPQNFTANDAPDGSLIVTSDTPDVTVLITKPDTPEGGTTPIPPNQPPFKIALPAGNYIVSAGKTGYINNDFTAVISPNQITRLNISLQQNTSQ